MSAIPLVETTRQNLVSEIGGAFMSPAKCDREGNLYIRKYAMDRPKLGPVVEVDGDGQRVALFDPAAFSEPHVDRADAYSPAVDGGIVQIAGTGGLKPELYLLRFSPDGSPGSAMHIEASFEPYSFAAFADGSFLISGVQRDPFKKSDNAHTVTAVFSADGRMLAQISFANSAESQPRGGATSKPDAPVLDLSEAESGEDGNIYAMRRASSAKIFVISPAGKIIRQLEIRPPFRGAMPSAFHVSGNRVAVSFWDDASQKQMLVVVDAQSRQRIANYSDAGGLGPSFACYSADEGVFTFLHLGEGNRLEVVRAEAK